MNTLETIQSIVTGAVIAGGIILSWYLAKGMTRREHETKEERVDYVVQKCWEKFNKSYPNKAFFTLGQTIRFGKEVSRATIERSKQ